MTRETPTGMKLSRKKKRVRRAFLPCRKKTVKTRPKEPRKDRKPAGEPSFMSCSNKIIKDGLKIIIGRSDLFDLHPALDNQGEKKGKELIPVICFDKDSLDV